MRHGRKHAVWQCGVMWDEYEISNGLRRMRYRNMRLGSVRYGSMKDVSMRYVSMRHVSTCEYEA